MASRWWTAPATPSPPAPSFEGFGADFTNHIFTREYVEAVVELVKERATFVADFWDIAAYLFVSPEQFEAFGVKAGAGLPSKPADPNRPADPRAKVFDDSLTAPFLAKDVDKFWNADNAAFCQEVCRYICQEYKGAMDAPVLEGVLETYIKGNEWPMGKVMNALRLALTGAASGLGIAAILSFIGRKEFARRMAFIGQRLG